MNMREWRQLTHDLDDDVELEFASEGEIVTIGHAMPVPEWNTVYLGSSEQDIVETLSEYEAEDEHYDDDEEPSEDIPEDREAYVRALAKAEDTPPPEGVEWHIAEGEACAIPPPKPVKAPDEATETM